MLNFTVIMKVRLFGNTADAQYHFLCESCRSNSREDYSSIVAAYFEFLETASEWLSRKVTDVCTFL